MKKVNETPKQQLDNLSQVRVKVEVVPYPDNVKIESEESRTEARKLPQDRVPPQLFDLGIKDPPKVPIGKVSLREAIDMIKGHALDPETFNAEYLAEFHDMKTEHVFAILDRFKTFEVYNRDDMLENKLMPWYTSEKLDQFFWTENPYRQRELGRLEAEKRAAWKEYVKNKRKQGFDPKLIEIAGLKQMTAGQRKLPEEPVNPELPGPKSPENEQNKT